MASWTRRLEPAVWFCFQNVRAARSSSSLQVLSFQVVISGFRFWRARDCAHGPDISPWPVLVKWLQRSLLIFVEGKARATSSSYERAPALAERHHQATGKWERQKLIVQASVYPSQGGLSWNRNRGWSRSWNSAIILTDVKRCIMGVRF